MDLASPTYTPASRAAELGMLQAAERRAERMKLSQRQSTLSASLAARAPEWTQFRQIVEELSASLRNTQNVSALSADVISLASDTVPTEFDRPRATLDAMRESKRIGANLSMLARVKGVAEKMKVLRERDYTPRLTTNMSTVSLNSSSVSTFVNAAAAAAAATTNTPSSASGGGGAGGGTGVGDARSLAASMSVPDFVARAHDIAAARDAASEQSLRHVDALDPVHEELKQRYSAMQSELQILLLYGVYGVPQCERNDEPLSRTTDSFMSTGSKNFVSKIAANNLTASPPCTAASFLPPLPLTPVDAKSSSCDGVPNPAGFLALPLAVQDALPQIVQALDVLVNDGYSCKIVEDAARSKAHAIVEHSIRTELKLVDANIETEPNPVNAKKRRAKLFTSESPSVMQKVACAIMNRCSFHFLAVLRRVDVLAFALDKNNSIDVYSAVSIIRRHFIVAFLFVVDLLLGRRADGAAVDSGSGRSTAAMLLNEYPDNEMQIDTDCDSEVKLTTAFWAASPLNALVASFPLTIYNLELMYGVLFRFVREYERIFTGYSDLPGSFVSLYAYLNSLKDSLVHNLKQDLRLYVKTIISARAGSLLQATSPLKKRDTQRSSVSSSSSVVLAPPHVEPLAHAVAVCMRIAISIPDVAQLVGHAVATDVLATLGLRSQEAVKLATQWTDAGRLANSMAVVQDEYEFEGDTMSNGSPRSERERALPAYHARSREVEQFGEHVKRVTNNDTNGANSESFALLSQEEWRAIVRLIYGLNGFVNEIRKWVVDVEACRNGGGGKHASFVPRWSTASFSALDNGASPLEKLRLLVGKGSSEKESALVSTVHAVLEPIEVSVIKVEHDVIVPAVELLRAETMLRCYWLAFRSLREVATACKIGLRRRKTSRKNSWNRTYNTSSLSRDSSVDDCAAICDEPSARVWEFDEYGDRIPQSESNNDVKEMFGDEEKSFVTEAKTLTIAENRMVGIARNASAELSARFAVSKSYLTLAQQDDIVSGVDVAIAAGIRSVPRRDRAMAVASRILLQTLMVEHENLAGECTAEQCRALMYASGMV